MKIYLIIDLVLLMNHMSKESSTDTLLKSLYLIENERRKILMEGKVCTTQLNEMMKRIALKEQEIRQIENKCAAMDENKNQLMSGISSISDKNIMLISQFEMVYTQEPTLYNKAKQKETLLQENLNMWEENIKQLDTVLGFYKWNVAKSKCTANTSEISTPVLHCENAKEVELVQIKEKLKLGKEKLSQLEEEKKKLTVQGNPVEYSDGLPIFLNNITANPHGTDLHDPAQNILEKGAIGINSDGVFNTSNLF